MQELNRGAGIANGKKKVIAFGCSRPFEEVRGSLSNRAIDDIQNWSCCDAWDMTIPSSFSIMKRIQI